MARSQFHDNIANMKVGQRRPYRLNARAVAAAHTGERILDAAAAVFWDRPSDQISLDQVAERAGVTVQTVIRRFGSKESLLIAAAKRETEQVATLRREAEPGNIEAGLRLLVDHYELTGDRVIRMLAEEQRAPGLQKLADLGRDMHRRWCARMFADALTGRTGVDHQRRLAQFVAVCDVYTWKLLRRAGLSRIQTELAILELLHPMTNRA